MKRVIRSEEASEASPPDVSEFNGWIASEAASLVGRLFDVRSRDAMRELELARKAFDAAARSLESSLGVPEGADAEVRTLVEQCAARAELDAVRIRADERLAVSERANAAHLALQAELDGARLQLKAERDRADQAEAQVARLTAEFERSLDELRQEHATVIGQQAVACASLPLDQLLTVFNGLARASTSGEVVASLVDGIAQEFSRVALFTVRGTGLEGVQQRGFDLDRDISNVVIPLSLDSLPTRVVRSGQVECLFPEGGESPPVMPFGGTPTCVLAIPIIVDRRTVAVIYADDSDRPEFATAVPRARAKFAEIIHQHARLTLVRVSVEEKMLAELREYAATLVTELEYTHTADADLGKHPLERQRRLGQELERARRIYAQRIAGEEPAAAGFFERQLAEARDARTDTIFCQDLTAIMGSTARPPQPRFMAR